MAATSAMGRPGWMAVWLGVIVVVGASSLLLSRRGRGPQRPHAVGRRVLLAVAHPEMGVRLARLGSAIAAPDRGSVVVLHVASSDVDPSALDAACGTVDRTVSAVTEDGLQAVPRVRVQSHLGDGVAFSTLEYEATLVVMGWPSGGTIDLDGDGPGRVLDTATCPLLVTRFRGHRHRGIVLRLPPPGSPSAAASLRLSTIVADRLGASLSLPVIRWAEADGVPLDPSLLSVTPVAPRPRAIWEALDAHNHGGDAVLALCHGVSTNGKRLSPTAAELYDHPPAPADAHQQLTHVPSPRSFH